MSSAMGCSHTTGTFSYTDVSEGAWIFGFVTCLFPLKLLMIRTQAEMGHTCRGTINLATATITVDDACNFVISNGGAQTYHLKASCEVERQRWITALELAKAKAARMQAESGKSYYFRP